MAEKLTHTLGPWSPEWELRRGAFCQVSAFSSEGNRILRVAIESFRPVEDALLIAAAPDLLAALKALLPEIDSEIEQRQNSGNDEYWRGLKALSDAGQAAIAKATGRAALNQDGGA